MKTNTTLFNKLSLGLFISLTIFSCRPDKEEGPKPATLNGPSYIVPITYSFSNVSYAGQTDRIIMLDSMSNYIKTGNTGTVLDAIVIKNMYSNTGNPFGNAALDTGGKQLKNKTFSLDQTYFEDLFDSLAVASQSAGAAASNGNAGVEGGYLFDRNGVEVAQIIRKQLMGAVFYYQAVETYLTNLPIDDNTTVIVGEGTAQEHHADEAFGYFGAPIDFPSNVTGLKYWAYYSNQVNPAIGYNQYIMNAFLKLRAAISNKDNTTRDAQIIQVRVLWEQIVAASAIFELKTAKSNYGTNNPKMRHYLSEAVGFINSLKYNSNKKISNSDITAAVNALGTNFYTISTTDIDNAIAIINTAYGFDLSRF